MLDRANLGATEAAGTRSTQNVIDHGTAVDWFLCDMGHAAGFFDAQPKQTRQLSFITRLPLLTAPDPWYFAGLVARESSAISTLFGPRDAGPLLREVFGGCDAVTGRTDSGVSALVKTILGCVGLSSVICGTMIDDAQLSGVICALMSNMKGRANLGPASTMRRQVRAAFDLHKGAPFWWREFRASCELPAKAWPPARTISMTQAAGRNAAEQNRTPGRLLAIPATWAARGRSLRQKSRQSFSP